MAAGEQVAFQPAFAQVLGQHGVHDAAILGQELVPFHGGGVPVAVGSLEALIQTVGHSLVRSEDAEVFGVGVELEQVADVAAQFDHILFFHAAGGGQADGVILEIGGAQIPQQLAAVGVGVGRNAAVAGGGQFLQFGDQGAVFVKQLLGMVAAQPFLDLFQVFLLMGGAQGDINGHLMGAEGALDGLAVHHLGAGPSLGGTQHDHGPLDMAHLFPGAGAALDVVDLLNDGIQGFGHLGVHGHGVVALDKVGLPGAAQEEMFHLLVGHAAEHCGVGDLVAVQVQNGQHGAVALGVQELVGLPAGGQGAGLGFAVAHRHSADEVGVIEHSAEGMGNGIAQLAALVDGARSFGRHMAGDAAGEAELLEQPFHAFLVPADVGVHLAVGAVQVGVGHKEVAAMARAGDEDHILIVLLDDTVQVHIHEVLAGHGAPVAHDLLFHVVPGQGTAQQGVIQQIELARRQIVGCPPVGVDLLQVGGVHILLSFLIVMVQASMVQGAAHGVLPAPV